jgi:[acyl-carrier-protein] S-malonyltransferase
MGRDLYDQFPVARAVFEEADDALGFSLSKLCFEGPEEDLRLTENTQPAILTVSIAAARVLSAALAEHGLAAAFAAGHSLGEYSAHVAAGTFSFADAVRTVRNRGRFMQQAVPQGQGAMAAILGLPAARIHELCAQAADGQVVAPANLNSPDQTVISGNAAAVERAAALCKEAGAKRTVMLPVSAPFHCALMQPAQDNLMAELAGISFHDANFPIVCNVDARLVTGADDSRDCLVRQVTGSVRWVECMQLLMTQGVTHFVEVGPGKVLSGLMRQIDRAQIAANVEDSASLEKAIAKMTEVEVAAQS